MGLKMDIWPKIGCCEMPEKVNYPPLLGFPAVYVCTAWIETHTYAQRVLLQLDRNQDPPPSITSISQLWLE